jgi:hypothetical protein
MNNLNPSRNLAARPRAGCFLALSLLAGWPATSVTQAAGLTAIPWNQISTKAGANYQGDGLAVTRHRFRGASALRLPAPEMAAQSKSILPS